MTFNPNLKFGDKDNIKVIRCDFRLHRDIDAKGRPSSGIYGGTINLIVEASIDSFIFESITNAYKPIDGVITFKNEKDQTLRELIWEKGYVITYREVIDTTTSNPMVIEFTISAETIKIGNAKHKNEWPK